MFRLEIKTGNAAMTLSDHAQRQLDIASGAQLDRLAEARRRAALADAREREERLAHCHGTLPNVPWAELVAKEDRHARP